MIRRDAASARSLNELKAVVIGCGRMGAFTAERVAASVPPGWMPLSHADAVATVDGVRLAGLCDVSEERLRAAGEVFGVDCLHTDFRALIDEVEPDIVCIATRTPGRCEIIEYAAGAGARGIHAEKPLCNRLSEGEAALAAVREAGAALTYGAVRRFMDAYRRARELCQSGAIGEPTEVLVEHGFTTLMWNHPHSADLLVFFSGCTDVTWVSGLCDIAGGAVHGATIDDDPVVRHAFVEFANGITGVITRGAGLSVHVHGTEGVVSVLADGSAVTLRDRAGGPYFSDARPVDVQPEMSGTQRAITELREFVCHGSPVSVSPEEILAGQRILFAVVASWLRDGARFDPRDLDSDMNVTGRSGGLPA